MNQSLIFGILFWKYYFGDKTFLFLPIRSSWHRIFLFFNFRFSNWSLKVNKNERKRYSYYNTVSLKKLHTHFMNLNSLDIEKNMLLQHSQKPFWLYKFSSKHVSVWCQKKHLHCTISWRPRTAFLKHFESKCLYISVYLRKKIFVPDAFQILFQKFYLVGGRVGGRLNNFLQAAYCLDLVNCFTIFNFYWNFWKFNHFSHFDTSICGIKDGLQG